MTTDQIRIRLTDDETKELKALANKYDLQPTQLAALFVRASMRAVWANQGRVSLPLNFLVEQEPGRAEYQLNEQTTKHKGRK